MGKLKEAPLVLKRQDANKVMTPFLPLPNRLLLLYRGHQLLKLIFGILIGSLAVLGRYTRSTNFDSTAILMCLVDLSVLILACVLPQSIISICYFLREGRCVGLEAYIWTGAMVLDDYMAMLMINIEYIGIVIFPAMILLFIGTLGWKLRRSVAVHVGSSKNDDDGVNTTRKATEKHNKEEIISVEKTNSTDKLELFEFLSYVLQLSLVAWTKYKGNQGSTPVLSDFLLFLGSALGTLGVMLASPLAGLNSHQVSVQVLPVLHKTCAIVLSIAVHTLAAGWQGNKMIYVCLPELIAVLVWLTICFGESMSVTSSFTSHKSQVFIVSVVVAILARLISCNISDRNMRVSRIIWLFWISASSSAFCQFHVWLLHGWPGSSSESNKLIHLLKFASTVGSVVTAAILVFCAYIMVTDTRIMYEAIYSVEHKTIAAVVPLIFLLTLLVWCARCYPPRTFARKGNSTEIRIEATNDKRMTSSSTRTESGAWAKQPVRVYMEFNCVSGDYGAFMDELRGKLAHHPDKANVHGRPVLAMQQVPSPPKRWVHVKLVGYDKKTTTLAVRDDTVDLIGFQAQNGSWYESGKDEGRLSMLTGSIFLGCDLNYGSLLLSEKGRLLTYTEVARWVQDYLLFGRRSATDAINTLSVYQQQVGETVDLNSRRALAVLMVIICECARLAPIYNTVRNGWDRGVVITEQQVWYMYNWRRMSDFLTGRKLPLQQFRLRNMGILVEADAVDLVHLVFNPQPQGNRQQHEPAGVVILGRFMVEVLSVEANYRLTGTIRVVDPKGGRITTFYYPSKGTFPSFESLALGRAYFLQVNLPVSVCTSLMSTCRHISADNRFTVEVNPDGGSDDCMDDDHEFIIESKSAFCSRKTTHSTTDANGSNSVIASSIKTDIIDANDSNSVIASSITTDITQDDDENHLELHDSTFIQVPCDQEKTDSVITITHPTKKGQIEMAYVVLSNAVMATVQVKLSPKGVLPPGTIIRVYGKITAQCNRGNIFLLARRQEVGETRVDVLHASDGLINIPIPLARTVFAITIGSPLILEVKLHVECSSYENTISFEDDLHFPIFGELPHHTSKIDGPDMVAQVVITAT